MSQKELTRKIYYLEDIMLRSKNYYEQLKIRERLMVLRKELQRIQFNSYR